MSYTKDILFAILLIAPVMLVSFSVINFNAYGQPTEITEVNATARFSDVLLEWSHDQINTTDYFIDRGTGFNLTSLTHEAVIDITAQNQAPEDVSFSPDGLKMYMLGIGDPVPSQDFIYEYDLTSPFNITSATFLQKKYINEDETGQAIFLKPDGTKIFLVGFGNSTINQYSLSPSYDISSLTLDKQFSLASSGSGLLFSTDGSKFYITIQALDEVREYTMSTPWDIGTATLTDTVFIGTNTIVPRDIAFSLDGRTMIVIDTSPFDQIDEYTLSIPFNVSSAVYDTTESIAAFETQPEGFFLKTDNTKLFVAGGQDDEINTFNMTVNFNNIVPSVLSANGNITTTAYLDTTVNLGTTYVYKVTSTNTTSGLNGTGTFSNPVLTNNVPSIVTGLSALYIDESNISLDWDDIVSLGEGMPANPSLTLINYTIYDRDLGIDPFVQSGTSATSDFNFPETFPQEKEFKVQACNEVGCGTNSTIAQSMIVNATTPNPVTNFTAVANVADVDLTWVNGANTTDHEIKRNGTVIATSTLVPAPDFFDDFSTDKGWISNDTGGIFLDTVSGTINYTDVENSGKSIISLNIENIIGDIDERNFSIRTSFTLETDSGTGNPEVTIIGISEEDSAGMSGNDCLSLQTYDYYCMFYRAGGHNHWQIESNNGTLFNNSNLKLGFSQGIGVTVYPELIIDYPYLRSTVYSDSSYTTILNNDVTTTINLNTIPLTNDLKYLWFGESDNNSIGFGQTGYFDSISFWNGINITESTGSLATTWKDTGVDLGTVYQYSIKPINNPPSEFQANGTETFSNTVLTNDVPDQVQNLTSDYTGSHSIFSDWDSLASDSGSGAPLGTGVTLQNHRIYIQDLGGSPFTLSGIGTTASDFTSTGVNFPDEKEIKVQACNELGCGANSTIAQVLAFPLANPVLSASNNILNGINATWTQSQGTGIIGYDLYNSTDGIIFDLLTSVGNNTKFFFDTPHNVCYDQDYRLSAFTPTQNGTNSTASGSTLCDFLATFNNINIENVGDTFKISGDFDFAGGNLTSLSLKENGVITDTNGTFVNYTSLGVPVNVPFVFWERANLPTLTEFNVTAIGQDQNFELDTREGQVFGTREYLPLHKDAIVKSEGQVNYTHTRFNDDDSILLKVNRIGVPEGETWQIECIYQDVIQALDTQDTIVPAVPTVDWIGTWDNTTNTGYFNSTIAGTAGGHVYISCFNDNLLFSTTSFTNSSLALFGIQAFDLTFGSFLGVPVGIFFVILAAGMANKRTAPTWIVVLVAIAGIMSTIGFFTLEPIVWGLALVTAMLGLLVNQKIF